MKNNYILASKSPRRRELLKLLGIDFTINASNICEDLKEGLTNEEIVMDLAFQKAEDILKNSIGSIVLGFDTLVILDGIPLGKPKDRSDAFIMIKSLSGRKHRVLTGCAILGEDIKDIFYDYADVYFNEMSVDEINEYLDTDEPYDKAGAYGIQGYGAKYIKKIEGDYYSVMGVPLQKLYNKLRDL
ncbi:Septum formation protein Maf [Candidatus Izimaplasma bacterium HR1]|uniref:Maf family protein n=1 Tax=Candidatus Izimoplasma sp. HR1 TaxID=1541959 RepID=UPI0004F81B28|nr:Septum formation protein Maf [Candidatus Izimaplasma bacterium HR1]